MKFSDLLPNPKNPREISDQKLEMLKKSMIEFGSLDGIIYNNRTKKLVGAHQRRKIYPHAELMITQKYDVPTITGTLAEGYAMFDGERFPYRIVDWDESKEKAANLAANKGAGDWDVSLLSTQFEELKTDGYNLDLTMFDASERTTFETISEVEIKEKEMDENLHTEKECPSCGYKW